MLIGSEYRDVNDNRLKVEGKTTASVKLYGKLKDHEVMITTKKTNPLLSLDWMNKLGITLDTGETGPQINQVTEDPDITLLKKRFKKLFNENHTVKGLEVKIQLKEDAKLIQQRKDKSVKIALDSQKLKKITIKRKTQMPNMEE